MNERNNFKEFRVYIIKGIIVLLLLALFIYNFIQLFKVKDITLWKIILLGLLFLYCAFGAIIPEGPFYILHWFSSTSMDQYNRIYIGIFKVGFWVILLLTTFVPLMIAHDLFG